MLNRLRVSALLAAIWLITLVAAQAQNLEEKYLQIHDIVQQAENYKTIGQPDRSLAKFKEVQTALLNFQRLHPDWNPRMVTFRLSYLADKINPPAPKGSNTPVTAATVTTPQTDGKAKATATGVGQVKLLNPGVEPRQVLRLHPKAGDKQTLTMTMKMGMDMQMGEGQSMPMKMPAMKFVMDETVGAVSPGGDISYETVMTDLNVADDPDVMPQIAQALKTSMGGMKGMAGSGIMTDHGITKDIALKLPEGADPQVRQVMDQMKETFSQASMPLPEEPVGVGAKWEVKKQVKSQNMNISQTANYELVSLEGERMTARSVITQTAANQKISSPAMPGMKFDLTKMSGNGKGEIVLDLGKVIPAEGVMDFQTDMSMSMNAGGKPQTMVMKMNMNVQMEAK